MKKNIIGAISILIFTGYMIGLSPFAESATTRGSNRDLAALQISITMLNEDARLAMEASVVVKKRLSERYDLTFGQIDGLLGPNMPYGDLAAVLTFAQKMSGGVKDANVDKVIKLRQNGLGWGRIAEKLRLDLSGIASSLSRFEEGTHSDIKEALFEFGLASTTVG